MGFFKGVMQQLNIMDERKFEREKIQEQRDFQVSQAEIARQDRLAEVESDRAFQREIADRALQERRREALLTMVPNLTPAQVAALGIESGDQSSTVRPAPVTRVTTPAPGLDEDTGTIPSEDAVGYAQTIMDEFGVPAEAVAPFVALGRAQVAEVGDAVNASRQLFIDAGRIHEFTPEVATDVLKHVRVLVEEGEDVNIDGLATYLGVDSMSESDVNMMSILAQRPDTYKVVSDYQPRFPLAPDEVKPIQEAFSFQLQQDLEMKQAELTEVAQSGQGDATAVANELSRVSDALNYMKENGGVATTAIINEFGGDTFRLLVEQEPRLMYGSGLSGSLGVARRAFEARNVTFSTMEEAQAAVDSGRLQEGTKVTVQGRTFTVGQ